MPRIMSTEQDHYATLGVLPTSDDVVIKGAYKALMLKYHPDTSQVPDAAARAMAINEAYATLGNAERRAAYDAKRSRGPTSGSADARHRAGWRIAAPAMAVATVLGGVVTMGAAFVAPVASNRSEASTIAPSDRTLAHTPSGDASGTTTNDAPARHSEMVEVFGRRDAAASAPAETPPSSEADPIDYAAVRDSAAAAVRVLQSDGLDIARVESLSCAERVASTRSWAQADRCAAFDHAVRLADLRTARDAGTAEDAYFATREKEAQSLYASTGVDRYLVGQRIQRVRMAASTKQPGVQVPDDAPAGPTAVLSGVRPMLDLSGGVAFTGRQEARGNP
jgi:curved DNA-binding protein CbpA